jgi:hypothetical protein
MRLMNKGVLHRDLKPANIMIDGRGKLLITDFGLAKIADDVCADDIRSGTPAYMSPEQLAGREVTESSDIYSLGIILHEIYTGTPVWAAESRAALFEKRRHTSTPLVASAAVELDPMVKHVIRRCLDQDPAARPQTAISVAAALPGGDPRRVYYCVVDVLLGILVAGNFGEPSARVTLGVNVIFRSLSVSLRIWMYYEAVEACVRRIWASTFSSWSRLVSGRFTDRLVSRDLLVGVLTGVTTAAVNCYFSTFAGRQQSRPSLHT